MQWSTDVQRIKAAIWQQAFLGNASVTCPIGQVGAFVAERGSFWRLCAAGDAGFLWMMSTLLLRPASGKCDFTLNSGTSSYPYRGGSLRPEGALY